MSLITLINRSLVFKITLEKQEDFHTWEELEKASLQDLINKFVKALVRRFENLVQTLNSWFEDSKIKFGASKIKFEAYSIQDKTFMPSMNVNNTKV